MALTVASATPAPLGSDTSPSSVARKSCAYNNVAVEKRMIAKSPQISRADADLVLRETECPLFFIFTSGRHATGRLIDRHASQNVGRHLKCSPDRRSTQTTATFGVNTVGFFRLQLTRWPLRKKHMIQGLNGSCQSVSGPTAPGRTSQHRPGTARR